MNLENILLTVMMFFFVFFISTDYSFLILFCDALLKQEIVFSYLWCHINIGLEEFTGI